MTNKAQEVRGLFAGVGNIVRFNPRFYVAAAASLLVAILAIASMGRLLPPPLVLTAWIGVGLVLWWTVGSLLASWWIYDLSDLYRWDWLAPLLPPPGANTAVAHAGFDEVSASLAGRFPDRDFLTLDFHDAARMTEPSIQRARRLCPPLPGTLPVGLEGWPLTGLSLVLFPLSAHEWREPAERSALLRAAAGSLGEKGRIVLLEHLRDPRNFLAFGPGFLHFHSETTWLRDAEAAGLVCIERFRVASFLRGFVFVPSAPTKIEDDR